MQKLLSILLLFFIIFLSGCTISVTTTALIPPPQGYSSWDEYNKAYASHIATSTSTIQPAQITTQKAITTITTTTRSSPVVTTPTTTPNSVQPIRVNITDLLVLKYNNDIDKQQQWQSLATRYNGVLILTSGTLHTVRVDKDGPYVDIEYQHEWITFRFKKGYESQLAQLKYGTSVVVQGKCSITLNQYGGGTTIVIDSDLLNVVDTTTTTQPSTTTSTTTTTVTTPPIVIDATQMYVDYQLNSIAADLKYKHKTVMVTGVFITSGTEIFGNPYICLAAGPASAYGLDTVQCSFDPKYAPDLASLVLGQQVTVEGTCQGYLINIILDDCILTENNTPIPTTTTSAPTTTPSPSIIVTVSKDTSLSGNNVYLDISHSPGNTRIWVETMILRSDIEEKTITLSINMDYNSGAGVFAYLSYQNPSVEVILINHDGVVIFDQTVPIQD
jgi:hypothetical protein